MSGELSDVLRAAVESGDFAAFAEHLAPDAVLRTSNERGRRRIEGAGALVEHLARPGPGRIAAWDAQEWPAGAALTFEWVGAGSTDRRRWYLRRTEAGEVTELWSAAARPASGGGGPLAPPASLLAGIGALEQLGGPPRRS